MVPDFEQMKKKNIIIAIPNPAFAEALKKHFENENINVLEVCVVVDHLVERLHLIKEDPSITLDGIIISSSLAVKQSDKRHEFLADVIDRIREDFSDSSIIFLSDEKQGHPLLAELVSMGIYNIFLKSQKSEPLNIKQLIKCIDSPLPYSEVKKYRNYDQGISWRRFVNGAQSITINIEGQNKDKAHRRQEKQSLKENEVASNASDEIEISEKIHNVEQLPKNNKPITKTVLPDIMEEELEESDFWVLPDLKQKIVVRDRIVGKSVISVVGVEKGVGTTHSSILIANYLASHGYTVKLLELSGNNEFVFIEKAYEGKNVNTRLSDEFEIEGVTYVKSTDDFEMADHLNSEHTHIVLDMGTYDTSEHIPEFHRASTQIVVASGSEWKQHYIKRFLSSNLVDLERCIFMIPLVSKQSIVDIKKDHDGIRALDIPFHSDPFDSQDDTDEQFDLVFDRGFTKKKRMIKRSILILAIIILMFLLIFFISK
ncbi:hypothetical protein SAMN05428961_11056 [Paenibacillus sp. OK060]|uniref:hypothetical protein n=1 Tax=Paenibacillus sp. OK060 TaxID=1881034 RepID=UPI00087E7E1D|nr:hypothetical protein [Paenibacillus sp. OK060]SDM14689.1 hypothetical protein SAMN05428961_11056 [Paenibacillus sp. OK060]